MKSIGNWYIDGRIYYHKIIDFKNPQAGLQELRYVDAMKMRYVKQEVRDKNEKTRIQVNNSDNPMDYQFPKIEEYFIYNPKGSYPTGNTNATGSSQGIKIARDAISYTTSGLVDRNKGSTLSISS